MPDQEEKKPVEELDLEEIHRQLYWDVYSDEARAYLVLKVVGKVDVSEERITEAIELYEEAGRYGDAAEIAEKAGMTERAIEIYEKAGSFDDAAEIAQKAGMIERAIEIYEKAGWFRDAAEIAEKAGMIVEAINIYWKAGRFKDAAKVAQKAEATEVAQLFSNAERVKWPFW